MCFHQLKQSFPIGCSVTFHEFTEFFFSFFFGNDDFILMKTENKQPRGPKGTEQYESGSAAICRRVHKTRSETKNTSQTRDQTL